MKSILFNSDMVKAILDGRKTVTRRIAKGRHPYQAGDILYVRETYSYAKDNECIGVTGGECPYKSCEEADGPCFKDHYIYKSSDNLPVGERWHPSIHMPKEAARIWLKVTNVRVERLQKMILSDFLAEGVVLRPEAFNDLENAYMQGKELFIHIWDSTIKKEQHDLYGWEANPFVWVIEFECCEKPENEE